MTEITRVHSPSLPPLIGEHVRAITLGALELELDRFALAVHDAFGFPETGNPTGVP
jgi:hypothetical protein